MLDVLAYVVLGIGLGAFTGMVPGIHVNNLTPMLVGLAAGATLEPMYAVALIVAMMTTHTFICYIPSTFLGVPEEGTALSVLPAHRLVLEGRGYEAIKLTALGSLGALMLSAALLVPMLFTVGPAYEVVRPRMHWLLLGIIAIMVALERRGQAIVWAVAVFLLSGLLGILTLDTGILPSNAALLPLLSGLFGVSVLLMGVMSKSRLPKQRFDGEEKLEVGASAKAICAGSGAGILTGIIPGIGPSQGTVLAQLATRSGGIREFLVAVSGVNTAKALLSFVALYVIARPRSGAAVAVGQLMEVGLPELMFLVSVSLIAGGLATVLHLRLGRLAAEHIWRLPYRAMCAAVIIGMVGLTFYYTDLMGLLVLATATAIGLLPAAVGVRRTHCMGVIMVPCILYFAGLSLVSFTSLG